MFYRAVIVKEKTNSKTITLRAKSKEDIEEMMPRIRAFYILTKMQVDVDI